MIEGLLWMVLLLSTITIFIKVSAITFCEKSVITVRYVEHCPKDFRSLEIVAKKMNCESVEQRCSDSFNIGQHKFQYHCVINAWRNATLEVCALNRTIFGTKGEDPKDDRKREGGPKDDIFVRGRGPRTTIPNLLCYCTEYSINGKVIQENYGADCSSDVPRFPQFYNSAEVYKYQTCFDLVKRNRKLTNYTVRDSYNPNMAPERYSGKLALPILTILLVILVFGHVLQ